MRERVELYEALLLEQEEILIAEQAQEALQQLGLREKLSALRLLEKQPGTNRVSAALLRSSAELHPVALSASLRSFYTSLFTLKTLSMPSIEKLQSRKTRHKARNGVACCICEAYKELYEGVEELGVATHTVEQVKLLLEV